MFNLVISPKASKDLDKLNDKDCEIVVIAMKILEENPFPKGKLIKKIKGMNTDLYRFRVDKIRVFFIVEKHDVIILRVLGKKDVNKFLR